MATITKRGPYQWRVQIRRRRYPTQFKTFNTRAEAEAWANMVESEMARGVWISRGETDTLVGLFNWSEYAARLEFDPQAYGLSGTPLDFWTDAPVASLPARMARRSSLALRFPAAQ